MNTKSTEYDSDYKGWLFFRELSELLRYRDLLHLLVFNNIKTRYKRSMLGVLWTLLNPILTMTVLVIAFSNLFRFSLPDYPVYLLTGLVIWNFFSQITTSAINAITMGGSLLRRIYLPRTVFSVAAVGCGSHQSAIIADPPIFYHPPGEPSVECFSIICTGSRSIDRHVCPGYWVIGIDPGCFFCRFSPYLSDFVDGLVLLDSHNLSQRNTAVIYLDVYPA